MTPTSTKATTMTMASHRQHHPYTPTSGSFSSAGHNASSSSSSSSPQQSGTTTTAAAASWRKPGQRLRQQVLDRDRVVNAAMNHHDTNHHMLQQLDQECAISRYYDVCDKVLDEFLQHGIDTPRDMIESYVLGHRLVRLLSTLLPRHRHYHHPDPVATRARNKSQEQLIQVLKYLDQIAILIDKEEHANFVGTILQQDTKNDHHHPHDNDDDEKKQDDNNHDFHAASNHHTATASTLQDLLELHEHQGSNGGSGKFKIQVSKSSGGGDGNGDGRGDDLGFSMIIVTSSSESSSSESIVDPYYAAGEPMNETKNDTSWMSNSILLQQQDDDDDDDDNEQSHPDDESPTKMMMLMPPSQLIRTGRTHDKQQQEESIEKSREDQIMFLLQSSNHNNNNNRGSPTMMKSLVATTPRAAAASTATTPTTFSPTNTAAVGGVVTRRSAVATPSAAATTTNNTTTTSPTQNTTTVAAARRTRMSSSREMAGAAGMIIAPSRSERSPPTMSRSGGGDTSTSAKPPPTTMGKLDRHLVQAAMSSPNSSCARPWQHQRYHQQHHHNNDPSIAGGYVSSNSSEHLVASSCSFAVENMLMIPADESTIVGEVSFRSAAAASSFVVVDDDDADADVDAGEARPSVLPRPSVDNFEAPLVDDDDKIVVVDQHYHDNHDTTMDSFQAAQAANLSADRNKHRCAVSSNDMDAETVTAMQFSLPPPIMTTDIMGFPSTTTYYNATNGDEVNVAQQAFAAIQTAISPETSRSEKSYNNNVELDGSFGDREGETTTTSRKQTGSPRFLGAVGDESFRTKQQSSLESRSCNKPRSPRDGPYRRDATVTEDSHPPLVLADDDGGEESFSSKRNSSICSGSHGSRAKSRADSVKTQDNKQHLHIDDNSFSVQRSGSVRKRNVVRPINCSFESSSNDDSLSRHSKVLAAADPTLDISASSRESSSLKIIATVTPVKPKTRPGPLAISTGTVSTTTLSTSRSRRVYSCSSVKDSEYESLSLSPNESNYVSSIPSFRNNNEARQKILSRHRLRDLKQDLSKHESFFNSAAAAKPTTTSSSEKQRPKLQALLQARMTRKTATAAVVVPNHREDSYDVSPPNSNSSSSPRLSVSPSLSSPGAPVPIARSSTEKTKQRQQQPQSSVWLFPGFSESSSNDTDGLTWTPNDYFASSAQQSDDANNKNNANLAKAPSWTAWSHDDGFSDDDDDEDSVCVHDHGDDDDRRPVQQVSDLDNDDARLRPDVGAASPRMNMLHHSHQDDSHNSDPEVQYDDADGSPRSMVMLHDRQNVEDDYSREAHYSDPAWFHLEDHEMAKAIEISPSDSFVLQQKYSRRKADITNGVAAVPNGTTMPPSNRLQQPAPPSSSLLQQQQQASSVVFTKVSKTLSPICETSTTNSTSYCAANAPRDAALQAACSSLTTKSNYQLSQDQFLPYGSHHHPGGKMCALDPRGTLTMCRRSSRHRVERISHHHHEHNHHGPVDLDDTIDGNSEEGGGGGFQRCRQYLLKY